MNIPPSVGLTGYNSGAVSSQRVSAPASAASSIPSDRRSLAPNPLSAPAITSDSSSEFIPANVYNEDRNAGNEDLRLYGNSAQESDDVRKGRFVDVQV